MRLPFSVLFALVCAFLPCTAAQAASTLVGTPVVTGLAMGTLCPSDSIKVSFTVQNLTTNGEEGRVQVAISSNAYGSWTEVPNAVVADAWHFARDGGTLGTQPSPLVGSSDNNYPAGGYKAFAGLGPVQETLVFYLRIPSEYTIGSQFKVHVATNNYYLGVGSDPGSNGSSWTGTVMICAPGMPTVPATYTATPSPTATPTPDLGAPLRLSVSVTAEGLASPGKELLIWLDYEAFDETMIFPSYILDPNLVFVDASPGYSNVVPGQTGPRYINWEIWSADPAGERGRKWLRVRVKDDAVVGPGATVINVRARLNDPTGGIDAEPDSLTCVPGAMLFKQQMDATGSYPIPTAANGNLVTYRLTLLQRSDGLSCASDFDALTEGTAYTGTTAPTGWRQVGQMGASPYASWAVERQPGYLADHFLRATSTGFGSLVDDCPAALNAQGNFCEGTVVTDAWMGSTATDLAITLRSNAQPGADWRAVWLVMSKDTAFGGGCTGNLGLEFGAGGARQVVGCYTAGSPPMEGLWYTLKATIAKEGADYRYSAKYWVRGQPEPNAWMLDYLDTAHGATGDFECGGGPGRNPAWAWRPGINNAGDNNAYDNWRSFTAIPLLNASVWDSIPAGVDFVSASPAAQLVPSGSGLHEGALRWDFSGALNGAAAGRLTSPSTVLEWKALVDCAEGLDVVDNTAYVSAADGLAVPQSSNTTRLDVSCGFTPTPTFTVSPTLSATPSVTAGTPDATLTPSPIGTWSVTDSPTRTATPSASPAASQTATSLTTATRTVTAPCGCAPTFSPTPSPTEAATQTVTASATFSPAHSATPSASPSSTPASTPTATPSPGTPAATAVPTLDCAGALKLTHAQALPNPNPVQLRLRSDGAADRISVDIYSKADVKEASFQVMGVFGPGWFSVDLPPGLDLGPGLHFGRVTAYNACSGTKASHPVNLMVIK